MQLRFMHNACFVQREFARRMSIAANAVMKGRKEVLRCLAPADLKQLPGMSLGYITRLSEGRFHIPSSTRGHRSCACDSTLRQRSTHSFRLYSYANSMSDISASDWNDVKSSLLGLIHSLKRADGSTWQTAHEAAPQYLEVRLIPSVCSELISLHRGESHRPSDCAPSSAMTCGAAPSLGRCAQVL